MNPTDIYLRAIKRTFADLYGVSPDTVDVSWTSDGEIGEDPPSNVAVGSSMSSQALLLDPTFTEKRVGFPQVSIAAIAALQLEPCARRRLYQIVDGKAGPAPRTTPMAPPGPASD